jgi:hypothetical protein
MKTYGGVDIYIHVFLTSAVVGGEWSASRLGLFTAKGNSPRYPLYRRLGGPQSRCGRRGEEKIFDPTVTRTPTPSVIQPIASHYTYEFKIVLICLGTSKYYWLYLDKNFPFEIMQFWF